MYNIYVPLTKIIWEPLQWSKYPKKTKQNKLKYKYMYTYSAHAQTTYSNRSCSDIFGFRKQIAFLETDKSDVTLLTCYRITITCLLCWMQTLCILYEGHMCSCACNIDHNERQHSTVCTRYCGYIRNSI